MIARILAIAAATLRESTRSAVARLAALLLLLCVPVMAWLVGDDEGGRVWAARTFTVEGLRLILPLAAVVGGAFLLRPGMKRGWALLPARRGEWFAGAALAGLCMILLSTALFLTGAAIATAALGDSSRVVVPMRATAVSGGGVSPAEDQEIARRWVSTSSVDRELSFKFERPATDRIRGEIEYELVWTQEAPPGRSVPFSVTASSTPPPATPGRRINASDHYKDGTVRALSRRRAAFEVDLPLGEDLAIDVSPIDPSLVVGIRLGDVIIEAGHSSPLPSILWLALVAIAAAALCMAVSLWFRSWSTAPTAALAGLLLLAALTLLPGITPTGQMAADRRAAVEADKDALKTLESTVARLPELLPTLPFDTYLRGREVEPTLGDTAWRALAALLLLPLGAITFRRRQIAK